MPERWEQIKGLFVQALELKPEDRSAFLAGAPCDDASIRGEVEVLFGATFRRESCPGRGPASEARACRSGVLPLAARSTRERRRAAKYATVPRRTAGPGTPVGRAQSRRSLRAVSANLAA